MLGVNTVCTERGRYTDRHATKGIELHVCLDRRCALQGSWARRQLAFNGLQVYVPPSFDLGFSGFCSDKE
jgi:hypothetical protein